MPAVWPAKSNWAAGGTIAAVDLSNLGFLINLWRPSAKGALFSASAIDTVLELAVGSNTQVLTVDSTTASGLKWAAAGAGGGMTLLSTTAITAVASISITSIDQTYTDLIVIIENAATANTNVNIRATYNSDATSANYFSLFTDSEIIAPTTAGAQVVTTSVSTTANTNTITSVLEIFRYTSLQRRAIRINASYIAGSGNPAAIFGTARYTGSSAISSIQLFPSAGNFTAQGNIYIYGVK